MNGTSPMAAKRHPAFERKVLHPYLVLAVGETFLAVEAPA